MYGVFSELRSLFRVESVCIDNWIFKLHYKYTVIILVTFSIVVNTRQFFGDPIKCTTVTDNGLTASYIDAYCWFNTYSLVSSEGNVFLQDSKFPSSSPASDYKPVYQSYYQWIGMVLLLQAACFYLPRFLWKEVLEEGRVKELVDGLQAQLPEEEEVVKRQRKLLDYMERYKGSHRFYALKFFLCEMLNFVNVIAQIFLTDWFLGNAFLKYGINWLFYSDGWSDPSGMYHPSYRYFPKETICDLVTGSIGGASPTKHQVRCVLPLQILNEKIYLFLCFYLVALGLISGMLLIYRVPILLFPGLRCFLLQRRAWTTDLSLMRTVVYDYDVGDWFLIHLIMKNMGPFTFGRLMRSLYNVPGRNNRFKGLDTVELNSHSLLGVYARKSSIEEKQK